MGDIAARVLILDDEEDIRTSLEFLVRRAFHGKRIVVELASSYEQAVAVATRTPKDDAPFLVLADFNLKAAKNGLDALNAISATHPRAKRVLMTAYLLSEFGVDLKRQKLDAFFQKPVSPPAFSELVLKLATPIPGKP